MFDQVLELSQEFGAYGSVNYTVIGGKGAVHH
jgi:hypothetical protein